LIEVIRIHPNNNEIAAYHPNSNEAVSRLPDFNKTFLICADLIEAVGLYPNVSNIFPKPP